MPALIFSFDRLLDSNDEDEIGLAERILMSLFWRVKYSSTLGLEHIHQSGKLILRHTGRVSNNNPLNISVFYWLLFPNWISFLIGSIVGIVGNLVASYLWENFLRKFFISP